MKAFIIVFAVLFVFVVLFFSLSSRSDASLLPEFSSIDSIYIGAKRIDKSKYHNIYSCFGNYKIDPSPAKWMLSSGNNELVVNVKGNPAIKIVVYVTNVGAFSISGKYYKGLDLAMLKVLIPELHN